MVKKSTDMFVLPKSIDTPRFGLLVLPQTQRTRLIEGKLPLENLPDVEEPESGVRPASLSLIHI